MITFFSRISLNPMGLKDKVTVAFCLMSLIPLLICVWLTTTYIFPNLNSLGNLSLGNISVVLVIVLVICILGFFVAKEMIDPVVKIAEDAKTIADGDLTKMIEIVREDEIGELGSSLNSMTQKIKDTIEELRSYSEHTKKINSEINKKVLALSALLEIGNLISSSVDIHTIFNFISQKLSELEDNTLSFVMLLDDKDRNFRIVASSNLEGDNLEQIRIKENEKLSKINVVDKNTPFDRKALNNVLGILKLQNIITVPIVVLKKQYGIIGIGNNENDFVFTSDEKELVSVFVKQAAIAIENNLLVEQAKQLAVKDDMTGLYNEHYIYTRLNEEIKRAVVYQRPCGYLLVHIDNFEDFQETLGDTETRDILKATGNILKGAVREIDKVARLKDGSFGIILPEKNKKQSLHIAEKIKKKVEDEISKLTKTKREQTVSIAVAENPIDGANADELMKKAEVLIENLRPLGKNRVTV